MSLTRALRDARFAIDGILAPAIGRRHFIVFRDLPVAYGRVPKVANTSVKVALTRFLVGLEDLRRPASYDRLWLDGTDGQTTMLRTAEAAKLRDVFIFAFVRDPFDRVASFYNNKVAGPPVLPERAGRDGVVKGMAFGPFLQRLAEMTDRDMDDHLLPQATILVHEGRVVPGFVGRHETMEGDWLALRRRLRDLGTPDLGRLPTRNRHVPEGHDLAAYYADPAHVRMVRERYAADFEIFYPDADPSRGRGLTRL